jgi:hypothetical protein
LTLWALGGVPEQHRSDSMSAAFEKNATAAHFIEVFLFYSIFFLTEIVIVLRPFAEVVSMVFDKFLHCFFVTSKTNMANP